MADGPRKTTMSVREMREILGLGKTDSYWLLKKKFFDVVLINGKMRVVVASFENWYANQVKYFKVNGPPPGEQLRKRSYSISDLEKLLEVTESTIYDLIKRGCFQTEIIDYRTRVPKHSFDQWYASQSRYQTAADREKDRELEEATISMPEMARLLGTHRNNVYHIINKYSDEFEFVIIAGQKRITKTSFEKWRSSWKGLHTKKSHSSAAKSQTQMQTEPENPQIEEKAAEIQLDKPSYSVKDAATLIGIPQKVIYRMVQSGDLKALSINKQIRIRRDDILWWLQERNTQLEPGGGD